MTPMELNPNDKVAYELLQDISQGIDLLMDLLRGTPFDQWQLDRVLLSYQEIKMRSLKMIELDGRESDTFLPLSVRQAIQELTKISETDFQHRFFCEGSLQNIQRPIDHFLHRKKT